MGSIKKQPKIEDGPIISPVLEITLPEPNLIEKISPWSMNFRQIELGPMQTHIRARNGQALNLLEIDMDRAVHQQGEAPAGTLTFGIPLARDELRWNNLEANNQSFLTFGGAEGFEGISNSGFHGVTFSVSNSDIDALADKIGLPVNDMIRSSGVFSPTHEASDISSLAELALSYLDPSSENDMALGNEEEILSLFLQISSLPNQQIDRSSGRQRTRAVRLALDVMEAKVEDNVPISTICEICGVSIRTLNRAFREAFGIGPKAYYLRMRLNTLRRVLLQNDQKMLISDLANPLGFWHMGQMARDYRAQFGELPSKTKG